MKYPKDFYTPARKKGTAKKTGKSKSSIVEKTTAAPQRLTASLPGEPSYCDRISDGVNNYIKNKCEEKANTLSAIGEAGECSCSPESGGAGSPSGGVDLVVLIDSSGSMGTAGNTISQVAPAALDQAVNSCNANANVTYLYLDNNDNGVTSGPWLGIFTQSHESYLVNVAGASSPFLADGDGPEDNEQGGKEKSHV